MPTVSVRVEIGDLSGQRFEEIEALVETGSTYTAVPRGILEALGLRPTRRPEFELASGHVTQNDVGEARIRVEGMEGTTQVIFADPGEPAIVGAVTLEAFLLGVDPVHRRLISVRGLRISRREA